MLTNKQKALIHIYADAADLNDPTYRGILADGAGCHSAADQEFGQAGFDRVMAALESMLWTRVASGAVPRPLGNPWIRSERYWRDRAGGRGLINSRQLHAIEALWHRLGEWLPDQADRAYLLGMARKAAGSNVPDLIKLRLEEAGWLIDALRDRLAYALASASREASAASQAPAPAANPQESRS